MKKEVEAAMAQVEIRKSQLAAEYVVCHITVELAAE